MNATTDLELLRRYADQGSDAAFTELVQRHCNLVWAAARRVSGNGEIARDVAQTVFTDLARKAGKLPADTVLAGWLYRAACHATANHIRGEARRNHREQAAMQQQLQPAEAADLRLAEELQPLLDTTLGELNPADRDAVVLRFLAGRSLADVGATLGVSEDTAQKRVSRALEKLREAFRQRGVTVSGGVTAAALSVAATQAAPVGLAGIVASGALAGAGATAGTFSFLILMKSKLVLGIVGGAVVASALSWQQHNQNRLAEENAVLRRQVAARPVTTPPESPRADLAELTRLREEHGELLRLRGQVAQLIQANKGAAGTDVTKRLQAAEARATLAEAEAAQVKAAEFSRQQSIRIINAMKNLGLAARIFATDHGDRLPTTFDEIRDDIGPDGKLPGGISLDLFEFFPHERAISEGEPQLILFREKVARQLPNGKWDRTYCLVDGSVQSRGSDDGDFSQYEREGMATLANAPKQ
ncbi:MAG TPA: sigma-70 family RNA polymerase sigma factor [Candidatus Limnocylindria bacterium]|jgi:RNA polymerase sigma factor (sigma-70 family)|nr:sigma-70 family RNA polymerase sigma factor [Candidatus Limnocylindria bacterium]